MAAAADDLGLTDDERKHIVDRRKRRAADEEIDRRDREFKEGAKRNAKTSFERLSNVLLGRERPTRESNEEYRKRKGE